MKGPQFLGVCLSHHWQQRHKNHSRLHPKLQRRAAVVSQRGLRCLYARAKALHQTQHAHGFGDVGVAVVGVAGLAKVLNGHVAVGAAVVADFYAVLVPVHAPRRFVSHIRTFVCAVHDGVARDRL